MREPVRTRPVAVPVGRRPRTSPAAHTSSIRSHRHLGAVHAVWRESHPVHGALLCVAGGTHPECAARNSRRLFRADNRRPRGVSLRRGRCRRPRPTYVGIQAGALSSCLHPLGPVPGAPRCDARHRCTGGDDQRPKHLLAVAAAAASSRSVGNIRASHAASPPHKSDCRSPAPPLAATEALPPPYRAPAAPLRRGAPCQRRDLTSVPGIIVVPAAQGPRPPTLHSGSRPRTARGPQSVASC